MMNDNEKQKEKCPKFGTCSAPLCPENLTDDRWFPDEGICTRYNDLFVQVQRKIAKRADDMEKYFTLEMLRRNCIIGKNISGIDPDCRDEEKAIHQWLSKHKPKRKLTEAERQARQEVLFNARKNKEKSQLLTMTCDKAGFEQKKHQSVQGI
ncbi:MAG: hypothetical protein A2W19_09335 [Spirochaetes bacterium RBG_16_49_21]|nr:MAG: hypothetical protein A2W19_09335 [Spirochaetes bacterium RBG_16_49_21]